MMAYSFIARQYLLLLLSVIFTLQLGQVADPVKPYYDEEMVRKSFKNYPVPDDATVEMMGKRDALDWRNYTCLNRADRAGNTINVWKNLTENPTAPFLNNTTYWFNEFLHVGHVHYDIVLMQVLLTERVDRIIMQRAACHAKQCIGIGSIDSFYKGYFAALFQAFNQSNTPVYLRWSWNQKSVFPLSFSALTEDFYNHNLTLPPIELKSIMCFEKVIRRAQADYGETPLVSSVAVQRFKASAYEMINHHQRYYSNSSNSLLLTMHFTDKPPYRILFAYRGRTATRYINNLQSVVRKLKTTFPSPTYAIRMLDTSDIQLDFQTQLQAVAESYVVICNHGAFEANMIYMRNASLLIEIFGHYGNNEIHTFHRLAMVFGLFYARVHVRSMKDHQQANFTMSEENVGEMVEIMQDYFNHRRYRRNMLNVGDG